MQQLSSGARSAALGGIAALAVLFSLGGPAPALADEERADKNVIVELSSDIVYKGEELTLTFRYADGRPVDEVKLYLPNEVRRAGGDSITVRWEDFADPTTGVVNKTNPGLYAQVKVGGDYRPATFTIELANVERPPEGPPVDTTPTPDVSIVSVWPEGDQGTLTYRCTAQADLDGCTLLGYTWYFGGAAAPVATSRDYVDHTFPGTGDFTIRVVADFVAPDGTTLSAVDEGLYTIGEDQPPTAKLYIKSAPEGAQWTGDQASGPAPMRVTFTGEFSTDPEGEPLKAYYWYFGTPADPVVTDTPTVTHEFKDVGLHQVSLVVEDAWGNQSALSAPVTVEVKLGEPELLHVHDAAGPAPDTVDFTVRAPYEKDAASMSFAWDFGDGSGRQLADTPRVSHTYQRLGTYTVSVECRYDYAGGSYTTMTISKTFPASGPVRAQLAASPLISVPGATKPPLDALPVGTQLVFSGAQSLSPYGKFVKYEFDLDGDGKYEHEQNVPDPSRQCDVPGAYTAGLRVTDERGNQATATLGYVVQANLTARLSVTPQTGSPPLTVTCDASGSTNPGGTVDHYLWSIGEAGGAQTTDSSPGAVIEVAFEEAGEYLVSVKACDALGGESLPAEQRVTVGDLPTAVFSHSDPVYAGSEIRFFAGASSSPNGAIVIYEWDLYGRGFAADSGGTAVDEGSTVTATYPELGTRKVRLRVTDELGFSAISSVTFDVVAAPPSSDLPFGTKHPVPTG